jgi:hypothetical protein
MRNALRLAVVGLVFSCGQAVNSAGNTGGGGSAGNTGVGGSAGNTGVGGSAGNTGVGGSAGGSGSRCGCQNTGSCAELSADANACLIFQSRCGAGSTKVSSCTTTGVVHLCQAPQLTTRYYAVAPIGARKASCETSGGAFTVVVPPEPLGAPCSCQRSTEVCAGAWGTSCSTLTCASGLQSSECRAGSIGRCVSDSGQVRISFYAPATTSSAETSCLGQPGYRWIP